MRKSRDEEEARYESEKSAMKEQHEVMARAKDEEINTVKTELLKAQKAAENAKEAAGMEAQARMDQMMLSCVGRLWAGAVFSSTNVPASDCIAWAVSLSTRSL